MEISYCVDPVQAIVVGITGIVVVVRRIDKEKFDKVRDVFFASVFLLTLMLIETFIIGVPFTEVVDSIVQRSYRIALAVLVCVAALRVLFGTNVMRRGVTHIEGVYDVTETTAQLVLMFGSTMILLLTILLFSRV